MRNKFTDPMRHLMDREFALRFARGEPSPQEIRRACADVERALNPPKFGSVMFGIDSSQIRGKSARFIVYDDIMDPCPVSQAQLDRIYAAMSKQIEEAQACAEVERALTAPPRPRSRPTTAEEIEAKIRDATFRLDPRTQNLKASTFQYDPRSIFR